MRLKIWQKVALMVFIMALGAGAMIYYLMYTRYVATVGLAEEERLGTEYLEPVEGLLKDLIQYRDVLDLVLRGDSAVEEKLTELQRNVDRDIKSVEAVDQKLSQLKATEKLNVIKDRWQELKDKTIKPGEDFILHTELVSDVVAFIAHIGDTSRLILDAELDSYYLMAAVIYEMPPAYSDLGRVRSIVSGAAAQGLITQEEVLDLAALMARVKLNLDAMKRGMEVAYSNTQSPELKNKLSQVLDEALPQTASFEQAVNQIMFSGNLTLSADDYFTKGTAAMDGIYKYTGVTLSSLDDLLVKRIERLSRDRSYILEVIAAAVVFTVVLISFIAVTTTRQISSILNVCENMRKGNYTTRADISSTDELGSIASSLNHMLDETVNLIQSREERDKIQRSVTKLLEEVSGLAEGDLTREAEVTADMTGALADSFNYVVLELRQIISNVQDAALRVTSASSEVQATMRNVSEDSDVQSGQIIDTSAAVDEMTISIKQVAETAEMSAVVAEEALKNAKDGALSVQKTIKGMNGIRQQVQETAKRIKRLGESSQEIGEIVQLIGDIADRTSILALNASIQAASAGEAGRGFSVVAQEVERLAERSTEATKRITTLIKTIQTETNEAVSGMEDTTREVVAGSNLANEAGKALEQIESVSTKMAELAASISMSAKQQARGSESVSQVMTDISRITQQTASGTKQAALSIGDLAALAHDLRESVSKFKLSEENVNGGSKMGSGVSFIDSPGNGGIRTTV